MALEINALVGDPDANSYIDLEEAEEYFESRSPEAPNWAAEEEGVDTNKIRALVTATRLLDAEIDWDGTITYPDQKLRWPRIELYDAEDREIPGDEIPDEVKWAVCEYAEVLLATDKTEDMSSAGISSLQAGSISINFSQSQPPKRVVLPDYVWDLVRRWGQRRDASQGSARLVRG